MTIPEDNFFGLVANLNLRHPNESIVAERQPFSELLATRHDQETETVQDVTSKPSKKKRRKTSINVRKADPANKKKQNKRLPNELKSRKKQEMNDWINRWTYQRALEHSEASIRTGSRFVSAKE